MAIEKISELKIAYTVLEIDIKSTIDEYNDMENSPNWGVYCERVADTRYVLPLDEPELLLGKADLGEQLQKSKFYNLIVEYIKNQGFVIRDEPFSLIDIDDLSKLNSITARGDSVFSIGVYRMRHKTKVSSSGSISILKRENDKIKLLDFSDIMEQIRTIKKQ